MSTAKRLAFGAGVVGSALTVVWLLRNKRLFVVSDVITGGSNSYPDLRAHVYFGGAHTVLAKAEEAIRQLARWRIVVVDTERDEIHAEAESQMGGFLSDITVSTSPLGTRHTRAIIRSRSRFCSGDLGENVRNIVTLQSAMDRLLPGG